METIYIHKLNEAVYLRTYDLTGGKIALGELRRLEVRIIDKEANKVILFDRRNRKAYTRKGIKVMSNEKSYHPKIKARFIEQTPVLKVQYLRQEAKRHILGKMKNMRRMAETYPERILHAYYLTYNIEDLIGICEGNKKHRMWDLPKTGHGAKNWHPKAKVVQGYLEHVAGQLDAKERENLKKMLREWEPKD